MALIEFKNFSFSYPNEVCALKNINLTVNEGEFIVICGTTGSGKTTLIRQIKAQTAPLGKSKGEILYFETPVRELDPYKSVSEIGIIFQNPDSQIVCEDVIKEISFSLENIGMSRDQMRKRIAEMVSFFGFENILQKPTNELSGGEKQLVNLCSVLCLRPKVILLDEPLAQLDPVHAKEFLKILKQLNSEYGITIIMSEHRLSEVFSLADKFVFMQNSELKKQGELKDILKYSMQNDEFYKFVPSSISLYIDVEKNTDSLTGTSIKELKNWAKNKSWTSMTLEERDDPSTLVSLHAKANRPDKSGIISLKNVHFRYDKNDKDVLCGLDLSINNGELFALYGGNGSGKSTLLKLIAELIKPYKGKIKRENIRTSYLAQNPMKYFFHQTVKEEICGYSELTKSPDKAYISEIIDKMELTPYMDRHPYDLSGGEQQRLGIAIALLSRPNVLILDEPTKGLDPIFKAMLSETLKELNKSGLTIVMATHDIEFGAEMADRCALLFDGKITSVQSARNFFSGNFFYTTDINKMLRDFTNGYAVTKRDVFIGD